MTKRILSLLICFVLVLATLPAVVLGAETEDATYEVSDLVYMQRLGVFPEDLVTGEALTRNELARIYFRIIAPSMADSEYISVDKPFKDLGDEHFAAAYVVKAGIMDGVSSTEFNPTGTITYSQIVKTLVCFLGYREAAEAHGGYPGGYNIYGTRFGFSQYAPANADDIVTTDVAAALFKLAVDTPVSEVKYLADGSKVITQGDADYLEKYLGIYSFAGVVSATYTENIYETGNVTDYHSVNIEDDKYILNEDTLSLNSLLGYYVNGVAKYDSATDKYEILYYEPMDNIEYVADSRDIIDYDGSNGKITFYDDKDKQKELDISDAYILYNDTLCENYSASVINPFADKTLDGKITMISNDADKKIDVVRVEEYQSYVIKKIHDNKIYNVYHPSVIFDIKNLEDGKVTVENVVGNPISLSSLEDGDIISVFKDMDGNIKKIIVAIDTYVGKIQEITTEGTEILKFKIDGNYFECANRLSEEVKSAKDIEVGDTVKLFFDYNAKVSNVETGDFSEEQIGFLVAMAPEDGLSSTIKVKVLTAMDSMLITKLKSKVSLNSVPLDANDVLTKLGYQRDVSNVTRQPIKYIYDKERDVITDIITVDETIDETSDGFYRYKNLTDDMKNYYRAASKNFRAKLLLSASTVVFVVPEDENDLDDESYNATDSTYFRDGSNTTMFEAYGSKANNPVAEILLITTSSDSGNTLYKKTQYLIVTGSGQRFDSEGEPSYYITGFIDGAEVNYIIDEEALKVAPGGTIPEVGDVLYVGFDKSKKIVISELIFDCSERKMGPGFTSNPTDSNAFAADRFLYGDVSYYDDNAMTISYSDYAPGSEVKKDCYPVSGCKIYEYVTSGRSPEVVVSSGQAIHDSHFNGYPAKVLFYTKNITPQFMIVFHE